MTLGILSEASERLCGRSGRQIGPFCPARGDLTCRATRIFARLFNTAYIEIVSLARR